MPKGKNNQQRITRVPFKLYNDVLWVTPEFLKRNASAFVKTASPDKEWLQDVAAAGATVIAKEIAGGAAASAMLGAYVINRLINITKDIDEKYQVDQSGYYTASVIELDKKEIKQFISDLLILSNPNTISKRLGSYLPIHPKKIAVSKNLDVVVASLVLRAYIKRVPNHIGSDGEKREWCIFSHKDNRLLQCYKTREEAEKALQRMHYFKNKQGAVAVFNPTTGNILHICASREEAENWRARYLVFLNALNSILDRELTPSPEDFITKFNALRGVFAGDLSSRFDTSSIVMARLQALSNFISELLEYAKNNGLAFKLIGNIVFNNLTREALEGIEEYREKFNQEEGMFMSAIANTPSKTLPSEETLGDSVPERAEVDVYSIEVETLNKKSEVPIDDTVINNLSSFLAQVGIPENTSFSLHLLNQAGEEVYTIELPSFTQKWEANE